MIVPTVHLNGTSKDELLRQVRDAVKALKPAIDALIEAGPNGRDYYLAGPDALREAQNEHHLRLSRLRSVREELEGLYEAIEEQGR